MKILLSTLLLLLGTAYADKACRFASSYSRNDLVNNKQIRDEFLTKILEKEAKFMKVIAFDQDTGLTLDGQEIHLKTGMPFGEARRFTSAKDEALQIAILAKVLNGDERASVIYSQQEAFDILIKKIETYEKIHEEFPGFGHFLPLLKVENGEAKPLYDQRSTISSVENGELYWSIYALTHVLEEKYPSQMSLAYRFNTMLAGMSQNSVQVFYEGHGKVKSLVTVGDVTKSVQHNQYQLWADCDKVQKCYLDSPFEGESFVSMMHLFAPLPAEEQELIFMQKETKTEAAQFFVNAHGSNLVTVKGDHFVPQEQMKYMFLPYLDSEINRQVFLNGEKARTWDANQRMMPGMFDFAYAPAESNY